MWKKRKERHILSFFMPYLLPENFFYCKKHTFTAKNIHFLFDFIK